MNATPSGFQFETAGPGLKELECPICLAIVRGATELPCEHLMCKECLEHYEFEIIEKTKRNVREGRNYYQQYEFKCSVCMTPYKIEDKRPVKSVDRMAQTSLPIKCLQKSCDWVGCIKDYEDHEKMCNFVLTQCPFFALGCPTNIKRGELTMHNQTSRLAHDSLILTSISNFADERRGYHQIINKQSDKIDNLEALLYGTIQRITSIDDENKHIKDKVDKQERLTNAYVKDVQRFKEEKKELNAKIEFQRVTIENLTDIIKEIQDETKSLNENLAEVKEDNDHLKMFAVRTSQLHMKLSHKESSIFNYLNEKDYWYNYNVQSWTEFADEMCYVDCDYLNTLSTAIEYYKETIYPKSWNKRINKLLQVLNIGRINGVYMKLVVGPLRNIFVTVYDSVKEFDQDTSINHYCKHSALVASYRNYEESCLYIALFHYKVIKNIRLLNWEYEDSEKTIQTGEITTLEGGYHSKGNLILKIKNAQ